MSGPSLICTRLNFPQGQVLPVLSFVFLSAEHSTVQTFNSDSISCKLCVSVQVLKLSVLQFPHLEVGTRPVASSESCCEDYIGKYL